MIQKEKINPLSKYFRQPKIYIKLPSSGAYYPPGVLEKSETDEYPVYAMTARDEIGMKTPDALLNGQATVDLIESCVPNIKNAWFVPSIDIDALLIAIRIATYGEYIDVDVTIPNTDIEKAFTTDLRVALDHLTNATFDPLVELKDMKIYIRPLTYQEYTKNAIKTLEEQRIFQIVNNDALTDQERIEQFGKSFRILREITIGMVQQCVTSIVTDDFEVIDRDYISEFIDNADKTFYTSIMDHLEKQRDKFQIAPFTVETTEEDQQAGAPKTFEAPLTLDVSTFFG